MNKGKAKIIIAQLEVVKAGMSGAELEPYTRTLDLLIKTMRNDIGTMEESRKKAWSSRLPEDICGRLCNCRSLKSDIEPLVNARWGWMKDNGQDKEGCTKEDALVFVLELLDDNGQVFDLTWDEYAALCKD